MTNFADANSKGNQAPQDWAVVGGGMLGITLAMRLAQHGQRVTLFEAAPELGGLASPWQLGDITWDKHYHVTLLSDSYLRSFLSELGLEDEMRWVESKTGFFANQQLYSFSNSFDFLRFPPLTFVEKLRLGAAICYASRVRDWQRLERIPVAKWLQDLSGRGCYRKFWQPLLKAKLGSAADKVSAAFIWATIQRLYKARRTGLKKEMFGYLPGGYARILSRAADALEDLGVDIRVDNRVSDIREADNGKVGIVIDDEHQTYDRVVVTSPSQVIQEICPTMATDERRRHEEVEYLGIICASMLVDKRLSPYYVTNIADDQIPITGVIEMTNVVDPADLSGKSLVYLPKYVTSEDPAWNWSDGEIKDRFLASLNRMFPHFSREDVRAFRISRVRHVMAIPTLNYSRRLPPVETGVPGVFAVNSAQIVKGSLNVNETIEVAEQAFRDVLLPTISETSASAFVNESQHHEIAAP